jgi:hypothetical protein
LERIIIYIRPAPSLHWQAHHKKIKKNRLQHYSGAWAGMTKLVASKMVNRMPTIPELRRMCALLKASIALWFESKKERVTDKAQQEVVNFRVVPPRTWRVDFSIWLHYELLLFRV